MHLFNSYAQRILYSTSLFSCDLPLYKTDADTVYQSGLLMQRAGTTHLNTIKLDFDTYTVHSTFTPLNPSISISGEL